MEQLEYNLLFRWFVGLGMDDAVWAPTTFTKNRDRLLDGDIARAFFEDVVAQARSVVPATGTAERDAAAGLVASLPYRRVTIGGDKVYDTHGFVETLRQLEATPHVALKKRSRTLDRWTTRHAGYDISQRVRKRIEEVFGWMKTIGGLRKLRHRGGARVNWQFLFAAAAYNLVRMRTLASTA